MSAYKLAVRVMLVLAILVLGNFAFAEKFTPSKDDVVSPYVTSCKIDGEVFDCFMVNHKGVFHLIELDDNRHVIRDYKVLKPGEVELVFAEVLV